MKSITSVRFKLWNLAPIVFLNLIASVAFAQPEVEATLKNLVHGVEKIGMAYAKPATTSVSTALATGWSNSAKALNLWQMEVRVGGNMVWIPASDRQFDLSALNLPNNFSNETPDNIYPTVLGSTVQNNSRLIINDNDGNQLTRFRMPPGLDVQQVYIPQLQVGGGLPFKSTVYLRFTPNIKFRDYGKGGSLGFAVQKELFSIKSKKQREFTTAILMGYNQLRYKYDLAEDYRIVEDPNANKSDYADQRIKDRINVWNFDALFSYLIPFESHTINSCFKFTKRAYKPIETYFEPFLSVGFQDAYNTFNAYGTYNIKTGYNNGSPVYSDLDGQDYAHNLRSSILQSAQGTLGFTLNIGFVRLFASYTKAHYSVLNAGLGFKFYAHKSSHDPITGF